ncbi:hypothetical protein AB0H12_40155 [Actinosynnema sp. NPDC023794]
MPKINLCLPDDLFEQVEGAGAFVSAVSRRWTSTRAASPCPNGPATPPDRVRPDRWGNESASL